MSGEEVDASNEAGNCWAGSLFHVVLAAACNARHRVMAGLFLRASLRGLAQAMSRTPEEIPPGQAASGKESAYTSCCVAPR